MSARWTVAPVVRWTATFALPADWHGFSRLAIRADSAAGYYAYNWFWTGVAAPAVAAPAGSGNTGTGGQPTSSGPATSGPATAGPATASPAAAYPTFSIVAWPKARRSPSSPVTCRPIWTSPSLWVNLALGGWRGYQVAAFNSGEGGSQTLTFTIPAALVNNNRIAIRLQGVGNPYYAFNWFWNS